ncbi:MAG: hypothetical protein IIV90_07590 [Oscillospiraceae bacterium]|nr:hypothetical protein [Oscillospiraceae bacterium]
MEYNYATKYSDKIQQKFARESLVDGRLSNNLDFVGARTVVVTTITPVIINDYKREGSANRYGEPKEVLDTKQELTMGRDRSFSGIIDKGNNMDQAINKAAKFLNVQVSEAMVPEMDKYKLGVLAKDGVAGSETGVLTAENVIDRLSAARKALLNGNVPVKGRTWFVTSDVFDLLVKTDQFKSLQDLGSRALAKGQVGEIFGAPVVEVPEDIMPEGVNFILVHKDAACSPTKIAEGKVHVDPPGISGNLVEGRYYYDCFVFEAKKQGVYVDKTV